MATVKELWIYPIKGCRGIRVPYLPMTALGGHLDRHWMLVDEAGRFITQREDPRLALIEVFVDTLKWSAQADLVQVKIENETFNLKWMPEIEGELQLITIWGQELRAISVAEDLANRISTFLGRKIRIVQVHQETQRSVSKKHQSWDALVGFADGYPFLAVFSASFNDLNSRLTDKINIDRFRANIVIENNEDAPFLEDQLKFISIGKNEFSIKLCSRCIVINTDQVTGERQKNGEPLKVLAKYRNSQGKVNFGINLVHKTTDVLHEGDEVKYL